MGTAENNVPLLDAVEALQGRDGDKDDNSLLAVANLDLVKKIPKSACELPDWSARNRENPWTASRPIPHCIECFCVARLVVGGFMCTAIARFTWRKIIVRVLSLTIVQVEGVSKQVGAQTRGYIDRLTPFS